jgi:ATP-dependent RNA helicase DDX41
MSEPPKPGHTKRVPSHDEYNLDAQDEHYEPYVSIAQRRQAKLAKFSSRGVDSGRERAKKQLEELEEHEDAEKEEENRRERARKERTLLMEAEEVHTRKAIEGQCGPPPSPMALQTCF